MAKRKINKDEAKNQPLADNVHIKGAGSVQDEVITNTLTDNFMPYAMSIILSRAIPQIDGFKPSHRKLLYTMYNMGLLQSGTIKSANIVGRTMQLNPHGDAAIYETMIRLSRGNETLLYPYVDSKGNFGKAYSKNMVYAASRYTEAKLAPICHELFDDIKSDTVDFVDNYDNTMKEPTLLPVTFPSILCNVTTGIAAGMASSIASFNLKEICDTTIALMKNPDHDVSDTAQQNGSRDNCNALILSAADIFFMIKKNLIKFIVRAEARLRFVQNIAMIKNITVLILPKFRLLQQVKR